MSTRTRLSLIAGYLAAMAVLGLLLFGVLVMRHQAQRGVWFPGEPLPPPSGARTPLGTTAELTQYADDAALTQALDAAQGMGLGWLRQELRWDQIQPEPGVWEWDAYDRVIRAASARGFRLILFLNRTPLWARRAGEEANPLAPPGDPEDFVTFAQRAAQRYGAEVEGWQVWEEPNLMPHWGTEVILRPDEYAEFLAVGARAIRAGDADAVIATAGLAPTAETGGYNMSEITFLRWLYDQGAAEHFDAMALKPYGFWQEVAERVYEEGRLGLDRVVLVRELMAQRGDAETPIWFVEGGWAVLPPGWQGAPPPWGYDDPATQQRRLYETVRRATLEWPWVQVIALQQLQPDAPPTDPRWALALLDPTGARTPLGEHMARIGNRFFNGPLGEWERAHWEQTLRPALRLYDWAAIAIGALLVGFVLRMGWHAASLPWGEWGQWFRGRPEWAQVGVMAGLAALFYAVDNRGVALGLYVILGILVAWRFDLGMAIIAFAIPFYLRSKTFAALQFSMVELMVLLCAVVWAIKQVALLRVPARGQSWQEHVRGWLATVGPRDALDWTVLLVVLWSAASLLFAQRFGVAAREFRVVVLESAVWFWLVRHAELDDMARQRLLEALVASATLVALYGLYQWLFTTDIIQAEGVRRVRGVYGSPNNLALLLERVLPVAGAVALMAPPGWRRRAHALAVLPMLLCLFLTFSRGAWLLGVPAALLWLGWWGGRRAGRWAVAVAVIGVLALLPFLATERLRSVVNVEGGTWFIRLRLWEATIAMLRDFPLLGVGLDNFLYAYDTYRLPEAWREPDLSHPHQIVLHFWVALGLPGLALFGWQLGAFWRAWGRASHRLAAGTMARALLVGLGASMSATLAHGLIDNSYFLVDLSFIWMLTLALVGGWAAAPDRTMRATP